MAFLSQSPRRTRPRQGGDCPGKQFSDTADEGQEAAGIEEHGGSRLVLLAVMAFVLPVVVSVVVVQRIESQFGSAAAAVAGLAAAGLTALSSASIVKRIACRSVGNGANR